MKQRILEWLIIAGVVLWILAILVNKLMPLIQFVIHIVGDCSCVLFKL